LVEFFFFFFSFLIFKLFNIIAGKEIHSPQLLVDYSSAIAGQPFLTQTLPSPFHVAKRDRIKEVAEAIKASLPPKTRGSVGVVLDVHLTQGDSLFPFEDFNVKKWIPFGNLLEGGEDVSGKNIYIYFYLFF
jgi:hypothetical protein